MPTYKQTSTYIENGFGAVTRVFVVSDTYTGLSDLAGAQDVDVFDVESASEELELESGVFAENELQFVMDERLVRSAADDAVIDLVLGAQDPDVPRYCALLINPVATPTGADFVFRGRIRPEFSGEDKRWSGAQFSSSIAPVRVWKCSAGSFDSGDVLNVDLGDVIDAIESSWITNNVSDRIGYFRTTHGSDGYGHREVRWGDLVSLEAIMQKLLEKACALHGAGLTFTLQSTLTDLIAVPSRWVPYITSNDQGVENGRRLRYSLRIVDANGNEVSWNSVPRNQLPLYRLRPWKTITGDTYPLRLGPESDYGSIWVSWRLLKPTADEQSYSWRRYKTVAELLYSIAAALGMYVRIEQSGATSWQLSFRRRQDLLGEEIALLDSTSAALDLRPLEPEDGETFTGASWQLNEEGISSYAYDGGLFSNLRPLGTGEPIALTISPTWCVLHERGEDARFDIGRVKGMAVIPHNATFWDSAFVGDPVHRKVPGIPEYNRIALHTGMYVKCHGRSDDGSIGVTGFTIYAPVAKVLASVDGTQREFWNLAEWANLLARRDRTYFEKEYRITVPATCGFKSVASGVVDWRVLKLGTRIALDGITYAVVGIERRARETVVRLHEASRYAITSSVSYAANDGADGTPGAGEAPTSGRFLAVGTNVAGEDVEAFDVLAMRSDGKLYRARAHHADYRRIVGVALQAATTGTSVEFQAYGRVTLGTSFTLAPGEPLYLRTSMSGSPNLSQEPLLAPDADEDMFVELGVAETTNDISFQLGYQIVYHPSLP